VWLSGLYSLCSRIGSSDEPLCWWSWMFGLHERRGFISSSMSVSCSRKVLYYGASKYLCTFICCSALPELFLSLRLLVPYMFSAIVLCNYFFLVSWDDMRLSPLGTSATNWAIVPDPDDRWWVWSSRWNENWKEKPKFSEKSCPSDTLPTTNPT
jgi:hypothetical protein